MYDATVMAQKFFSAMIRTGERFGAGYIIEVLRGNKDKVRLEHLNLKTFGTGADMSAAQWREVAQELLREGWCDREEGEYPILKLNERSKTVLYNGAEVMLAKKQAPVRSSRQERRATASEQSSHEYDGALFERLRLLRRSFADRENVPAFMIFSDATLIQLAMYLPSSIEEIRRISGFSEAKTERYGAAFVQEIISYATENGLTSQMQNLASQRGNATPTASAERTKRSADTSRASLELWQSGNTIAAIAAARGLAEQTIMGHLAKFVQTGGISLEEIVPEHKIESIIDALRAADWREGEAIKPIKEALGESYSYGEIQAVINAHPR
jgi:ATP-dependent DNA helicase RecQ